RSADVVVARPRAASVARAMAVGARVVAFSPDDDAGQAPVAALEARRPGVAARGPRFVPSALDPLRGSCGPAASEGGGEDGAANTADVVWVVGSERREIIAEVRSAERAQASARVHAAAAAARAAERQTQTAGDLEDLGWGDDDGGQAAAGPAPDRAEIERLRRDVEARMSRAQRTIADAQRSAARWQKKAEEARGHGSEPAAREAERNADLERARMHAALAEMAELTSEKEALERAARAAPPPGARRPETGAAGGARTPPRGGAGSAGSAGSAGGAGSGRSAGGDRSVDDRLRELKRKGGTSAAGAVNAGRGRPVSTVDDELEALKRKMSTKNPPRGGGGRLKP